jgi:hypothetical protein
MIHLEEINRKHIWKSAPGKAKVLLSPFRTGNKVYSVSESRNSCRTAMAQTFLNEMMILDSINLPTGTNLLYAVTNSLYPANPPTLFFDTIGLLKRDVPLDKISHGTKAVPNNHQIPEPINTPIFTKQVLKEHRIRIRHEQKRWLVDDMGLLN